MSVIGIVGGIYQIERSEVFSFPSVFPLINLVQGFVVLYHVVLEWQPLTNRLSSENVKMWRLGLGSIMVYGFFRYVSDVGLPWFLIASRVVAFSFVSFNIIILMIEWLRSRRELFGF